MTSQREAMDRSWGVLKVKRETLGGVREDESGSDLALRLIGDHENATPVYIDSYDNLRISDVGPCELFGWVRSVDLAGREIGIWMVPEVRDRVMKWKAAQ